MLKVTIPDKELYDDDSNEFIQSKGQTIVIEHSLVSLSKWESKWKKPFLKKEEKTIDETIDYIRCMTITQNVNESVYYNLKYAADIVEHIKDYITDEMTATTFANEGSKSLNRDVITAEIIYYWMITLNIPLEWEKRHLSRLLTLINVCNIKNSPPKKMGKSELAARNRQLNAQRRKRLNSGG